MNLIIVYSQFICEKSDIKFNFIKNIKTKQIDFFLWLFIFPNCFQISQPIAMRLIFFLEYCNQRLSNQILWMDLSQSPDLF
jgi:hypothetical protein